ncbi:MAG: hypothetical protein R3C01_17120 [Planctomycetaceae bacterium]
MAKSKKSALVRAFAIFITSSSSSLAGYCRAVLPRWRLWSPPVDSLATWQRYWEFPKLAWQKILDDHFPTIDGVSASRMVRLMLIATRRWDVLPVSERRSQLSEVPRGEWIEMLKAVLEFSY